jgi:lysozyme
MIMLNETPQLGSGIGAYHRTLWDLGFAFIIGATLLSSQPSDAEVVCPGPSTLLGVDVSQNQGTVDWNTVAVSGVQFAFVRVSSGLTPDDEFDQTYAAIKAAGLIRGAYQFYQPGQDVSAQAALLLQKIGTLDVGDLPPVLDVEITGGQAPATLAANIQTWVNIVQQTTGRAPVIYTGIGFWNTSVGSSFGADLLWVANWGVSCPNLPLGWQNWVFWQYADNGFVPGIGTAVDLDKFNGGLVDLSNLAANYSICSLYDQTKAVHSGATIPIRLELCTLNGTDVSSSDIVVTPIGVTMTSSEASGVFEDSSSAGADDTFRFDSTLGTSGGYIVNLSTKGFATGTYELNFIAGADPRVHSVSFEVR